MLKEIKQFYYKTPQITLVTDFIVLVVLLPIVFGYLNDCVRFYSVVYHLLKELFLWSFYIFGVVRLWDDNARLDGRLYKTVRLLLWGYVILCLLVSSFYNHSAYTPFSLLGEDIQRMMANIWHDFPCDFICQHFEYVISGSYL